MLLGDSAGPDRRALADIPMFAQLHRRWLYTKLYTARLFCCVRLVRLPLKTNENKDLDVSPWGRQRLLTRGLFSDERPRNFGNLTVVVVHEEAMAELFVDFDPDHCRPRGNLIGLSNRFMRLKKRQPVGEFDLESVIPLAVTGIFHRMELPPTEGRL